MLPMLKIHFLILLLIVSFSSPSSGQDEGKMQKQQEMLLSREKQAELNRQQIQKSQLEKQKIQLAEQEKVLLKLRYESKEAELETEKYESFVRIQKTRMQGRYEAALKDTQIRIQEQDLGKSRRWILYLTSLSLLAILIAVIIYLSQRKTKRLNQMIISQRNELEQLGMVKDHLLSVVGHDMRSPLHMLLALSKLLQHEEIPADKMAVYMEQMQATLLHTSSLIDNLLQWAASQMQGYKPVIGRVEISVIIKDVTDLIQEKASDKNIIILNHTPPGFVALCDENMIAVILRNLLNNAVKFTPTGGTVEISAAENNGFVRISISDNGIGMSEENIKQFNALSIRPVESTYGTEREKGTGLGLLLCKTFTQLMNGRITVKRKSNGPGCIFELVLAHEQNVPA